MPKPEQQSSVESNTRSKNDRTPLERRLKLPRTPLSAAFAHLEPNWRAYIDYVEIAAREGDKEMDRLLTAYRGFSKREQQQMPPEYLCDHANVKVEDLIAAITPLLWRYSNFHSSVVTAIYNPRVVEQTAKAALKKDNHQDRTTFLKVSGTLPMPRGSNINILNAPVGSHGSLVGSGPRPGLPSAGQDVLELEAADNDEDVIDNDVS